MVKELLKRAIEQNNPFMTKDMIELQILFFNSTNPKKLSDEDMVELLELLHPTVIETEEIIEEKEEETHEE